MDRAPRYTSLDALRGLAALGVVIWHWQVFWWSNGTLENYDVTRAPLYSLFSPLYHAGWYAVDLFFVLSGFVFFWIYSEKVAAGQVPARRFAMLRFSRLYPLHLLTLVLVAIGQWQYHRRFGQFFMFQVNDVKHFVLNLLMASGWGFEQGYSFNGPAWSISVEVLLYAAFFMLCAARFHSPRILAGIVIATIAAGFSATHLGRGVVGFFMGGLVFYTANYLAQRRSFAASFSLALLVALVGLVNAKRDVVFRGLAKIFGQEATWPGYFSVPHLLNFQVAVFPAMVLALVLIERRWPRVGVGLGWLGDISYSAYLWHFPLMLATAFIAFSNDWTPDDFYSPGVMAGFYGVLIAVSLASFHFYEKPLQRLLRSKRS